MFFRFYDHPGVHLPPAQQAVLRRELLEIARASMNPVPDYQCLSSSADALDDKLIVVAYIDSADSERSQIPRAVAFTSALFLDVPAVAHPVLHAGLTVAIPALRRTGIVAQLFVALYQNMIPCHPHGFWVTTLAAVLSSLVKAEKMLCNTHPAPPHRRLGMRSTGPQEAHLAIARAISERHRAALLISPTAEWDEAQFVFRGSLSWDAALCFQKDVDDVRFWHRDKSSNEFFHQLLRPGMGDEVLHVGFANVEKLGKLFGGRQRRETKL
ncbi:hypothetical protein GGX14DRAFT_403489 [Mycena pura]|uniref:Uncharacterized protein n=1 Tax=Mycena pura TaxID=153505 RepID=A0AAD6UWG0_9AGAR|nr:hypothetical protein GGX14DRAFT_403489 [Mycena pura]